MGVAAGYQPLTHPHMGVCCAGAAGMLVPYTMASADESARSVMENRVQSLVQVLCIVHHILARQPHHM